jgi:hypothetical protein
LTFVVLKNAKKNQIEYRMFNEERGIKVQYRPPEDHAGKSQHRTGKVTWKAAANTT